MYRHPVILENEMLFEEVVAHYSVAIGPIWDPKAPLNSSRHWQLHQRFDRASELFSWGWSSVEVKLHYPGVELR